MNRIATELHELVVLNNDSNGEEECETSELGVGITTPMEETPLDLLPIIEEDAKPTPQFFLVTRDE